MSASDNPTLNVGSGPSEHLVLPAHASALPGIFASVGEWLGKTQTRMRRRSRRLKNDYPVRLLGVLMGTAFVFGVAIRVWSSHEH